MTAKFILRKLCLGAALCFNLKRKKKVTAGYQTILSEICGCFLSDKNYNFFVLGLNSSVNIYATT